MCFLDKNIVAESQLTVKTVMCLRHVECRVRLFVLMTEPPDLKTEESCFDSWHKQNISLFSKATRKLLGPTQPPKWVPAVIFSRIKRPICEIHRYYLVSTIRMSGAVHIRFHMPSWHVYPNLHFFTFT
jgi:hypothetical protein